MYRRLKRWLSMGSACPAHVRTKAQIHSTQVNAGGYGSSRVAPSSGSRGKGIPRAVASWQDESTSLSERCCKRWTVMKQSSDVILCTCTHRWTHICMCAHVQERRYGGNFQIFGKQNKTFLNKLWIKEEIKGKFNKLRSLFSYFSKPIDWKMILLLCDAPLHCLQLGTMLTGMASFSLPSMMCLSCVSCAHAGFSPRGDNIRTTVVMTKTLGPFLHWAWSRSTSEGVQANSLITYHVSTAHTQPFPRTVSSRIVEQRTWHSEFWGLNSGFHTEPFSRVSYPGHLFNN